MITTSLDKNFLRCLWLGFFLLTGFFIVSCGGSSTTQVDEENMTEFRRGKQLLREGRQDMALAAFLKVIAKKENAPESHFEAGQLYLSFIDDPISAIYHFRKYLQYKPESREAPMIEDMIETAKKKFAQTLPGRPWRDDVERVDLANMLRKEREEKQELYAEIERLKKLIPSQVIAAHPAPTPRTNSNFIPQGRDDRATAPVSVDVVNERPAQTTPSTPTSRTYTVKPGDTLSRVSTAAYGTPTRWNDIYQANRDQLASPQALRPGQVLRLP